MSNRSLEALRGHARTQVASKAFLASKSQIQRKMVEISIGSPPFKNSIFENLDEKSFDHCNFMCNKSPISFIAITLWH